MWPFSTRTSQPRTAKQRRCSISRLRLEALEDRCLLSAGVLDPSFGGGAGYVTTAFSNINSSQTARQVLVQPSGDIVVAGQATIPITTTTKHGTTTTSTNAFGVVEYNPDGSLNTAFGSGGIVPQLFAGSSGGLLQGAALEPMGTTGDSKILLAGSDYGQYGMALMRLNANGTLDTTFGNNGQVVTPIPESSSNLSGEHAQGVAVTSSGQIVVAGADNSTSTVLLARYNANGTLDTTFGKGGIVTTAFPPSALGFGLAMTLQPDGKIVVVGSDQNAGLVLRYNANGSLDTTFGNGGIVTTALNVGASPSTRYNAVAVYPNTGTANDGKIIVAGSLWNTPGAPQNEKRYLAVRYNPDGSLDSSFGGGAGYEVINDPKYAYPMEMPQAIAIEPDGKPILAGNAQPGGGPTYSQVVRLNADGSLDTTFGSGGFVVTTIGTAASTGGTNSGFWAVAIQPDGKIDAAGYAVMGGGTQYAFTLARYLASEPQIGSFTANPNPVTAGSSVTLTASGIADGNPGVTITQVAFYLDSNNDGTLEPSSDRVLGYATQTSPGVWSLTDASAFGLTAGTYTLFAQAKDSDGVFGHPVVLTLAVQ